MYKKLFCALAGTVMSVALHAKVHDIWIEEFPTPAFNPSTLNVKVGDTIIWNWGGSGLSVESTTIPAGATSWSSGIYNDPHTFSYVVTVAGTYNYTCAPKGISGTFTATGTSSVPDARTATLFRLNSNVVSDMVRFSISCRSLQIAVYDISGKILTKWSANNVQEATFSTSELSNGLYWLSINADNKKYADKLLVQH